MLAAFKSVTSTLFFFTAIILGVLLGVVVVAILITVIVFIVKSV